jgi:hypothetical protein
MVACKVGIRVRTDDDTLEYIFAACDSIDEADFNDCASMDDEPVDRALAKGATEAAGSMEYMLQAV